MTFNCIFSPFSCLFSGKARRGDGNDLTSNPKKLAAIGKELDQLSKIINDLTPVSEMPFGARCKSRKEKNKLASRACRLKKKAQHEANKLKCEGLAAEHSKLADTDTVFPRIVSFFESLKCRKFQIVVAIIILLCDENMNSFLTRLRKLFKGGKYSRDETFAEHSKLADTDTCYLLI